MPKHTMKRRGFAFLSSDKLFHELLAIEILNELVQATARSLQPYLCDGSANLPDPDLTKALSSKAADNGLIIISCGVRGNVIRILAPLTIPFEQVDEGIEILRNTFNACI